jgi:hypothetical protein
MALLMRSLLGEGVHGEDRSERSVREPDRRVSVVIAQVLADLHHAEASGGVET